MNALIRGMPDLVVGLRAAVHERGVAYETVDDIAGLPDRYTSKVLAPKPIKNLGYMSIGEVLGALGKALVLVDDPQQIERVKGRWKPRKRPLKTPLSIALSIDQTSPEKPATQAQLELRERMKELGKRGGKRRLKTMSKRARQRVAAHAARKRWSKGK